MQKRKRCGEQNMYVCKQCKGTKIKTRTNVSFGKSYISIVSCKTCGSTDIDEVEKKYNNRRRT